MDAGRCERHSGAQPGGGICATCLQERLILLWRGEGSFNWNTEEYCITPPLHCRTPPATCEPSDTRAAAGACFPVIFRVRNNLRRDDANESSKERREKIDRSSCAGDRQHQFSCELRSIAKELAALHEKKKLDKAMKKRPGTDSGCLSSRRHPHDEVATDVIQGPESASPGVEDTANAMPAAAAAAVGALSVPKAKVSILGVENEEEGAKYSKVTCFSAVWPAVANTKWARVLGSPVVSSNKIAPSKSDLLLKLVSGAPKAAATVDEEARRESGRNCETSGSLRANFHNDLESFSRDYAGGLDYAMPGPAAAAALLPPRYVLHPVADEDTAVVEMDKETKQRMEASRITVMTWLQSLPSPKAVHLTEHSSNYYHKEEVPDGVSVGNGVLEMCDEEEEEEAEAAAAKFNGGEEEEEAAAKFNGGEEEEEEKEVEMDGESFRVESPKVLLDSSYSGTSPSTHISSFGKFLRPPSQIYAPTRMVDIEIAAQ